MPREALRTSRPFITWGCSAQEPIQQAQPAFLLPLSSESVVPFYFLFRALGELLLYFRDRDEFWLY